MTGVCPNQTIETMIATGAIKADPPVIPAQVQPASLDLRLGTVAYRVRASFLAGRGKSVTERLEEFEMHRIDLSDGAVLEKEMPPNLKRAAADLGAGPFATFRHVILPLTMPGIAVGAFITFAICIGDYVTPQILGGGNDLALPQLIMLQVGRRADLPMAATLSIILMIFVTIAYLATARYMKVEGR